MFGKKKLRSLRRIQKNIFRAGVVAVGEGQIILRILIFYALIASGYTYEGEAHMMGKGMMESDSEKEELGICPLMGNPASKDYSYTYKGKTYYFCCPMCIERFKKNPQEYISKIKEFNLETYQKAPAGEN